MPDEQAEVTDAGITRAHGLVDRIVVALERFNTTYGIPARRVTMNLADYHLIASVHATHTGPQVTGRPTHIAGCEIRCDDRVTAPSLSGVVFLPV